MAVPLPKDKLGGVDIMYVKPSANGEAKDPMHWEAGQVDDTRMPAVYAKSLGQVQHGATTVKTAVAVLEARVRALDTMIENEAPQPAATAGSSAARKRPRAPEQQALSQSAKKARKTKYIELLHKLNATRDAGTPRASTLAGRSSTG